MPETKDSLMHGVDWPVVIYGFCMALVVSFLVTLRARNTDRFLGKPLTPWHYMIPDTLLGGVVGAIASLVGPQLVSSLKNAAGVFLFAGLGGALGWRLTDWWGGNGLGVLLELIGNGADRLGKAVKARQGAGGDDHDGKQEGK